eukprot:CAMPEP_0197026646 /NCGR_PEP_ID=MMETSP1384-20130603/6689_1 /TAXON_ID=29189 /ORGANISM="Ammonia sp." /LENGTH=378 /DNA_ID=CAMNT_0042455347 /DNA_START=43 /DNA_END=1179 /DNA_ORIENTATION=-
MSAPKKSKKGRKKKKKAGDDCKENESEQIHNVPRWIKKNEHLFAPPICNKLMYRQQLNIMFVGGPNTRKDFHIDCGEEFFYQIRGNMSLPTYQQGKRKVVHIKEGQVYLLRARIPHSPQRPEKGSLGLVVERQRMKTRDELDCLRYYVCDFEPNEKNESKILWEKWFFCSNLGTQLPPIVKEFEASEEFKSHEPGKHVKKKPPVKLDTEVLIPDPIDLFPFIEKNRKYLEKHKRLDIYSGTQTQARILTGPFELRRKFHQETWYYCLKGDCRVNFDWPSKRDTQLLSDGDCLIISKNEQYKLTIASSDTLVMSVCMDVSAPIPDPKAPPKKYDHENKQDTPWENMKAEDPKFYRRELARGKNENELQRIDNDITLDKV